MNPILSPVAEAVDPEIEQLLDEMPLAYVEADKNGVITCANRIALEMHSEFADKLVGMIAWELTPVKYQEASRAAYLSFMQSGDEPPVVRRSIFTNTGEFRNYDIYRSLIRDAHGQPAGMRMVGVEVTEMKNKLDEAQERSLWLRKVMDSLVEAVLVTDALGFIRNVNPAAEALFGWKTAELSGQLIEKRLPLLAFHSADGKPLSFQMALDSICIGNAMVLDCNRNSLSVEIIASPIIDKQTGYTEGVVSLWRRIEDAPYEI